MVVVSKGVATGEHEPLLTSTNGQPFSPPDYDNRRHEQVAGPSTQRSGVSPVNREFDDEEPPPAYERANLKRRPPVLRRFFAALAVAVLVYLLGLAYVASAWDLRPVTPPKAPLAPTGPTQEDGKVVQHFFASKPDSGWTVQFEKIGRFEQRANLQLNLYMSEADVSLGSFLVTRGSTAKGTVIYQMIPVQTSNRWLAFNITVDSNRASDFAFTSAAILERTTNSEVGVGIYLPDGDADMSVVVQVQIPVLARDQNETLVRSFRARTHDFMHNFLLDDRVIMDILDIHATGSGAIFSQAAFSTTQITMQTYLGAISGELSANLRADLRTVSGPIVAKTSLGKTLPHGRAIVPSLSMITVSGLVEGSIQLFNSPTFSVFARTVSASILIPVSVLPLNATLTFDARSERGDVQMVVPPTFEGSIELTTQSGVVGLSIPNHLSDPAGLDRKIRTTEDENGSDRLWRGSVWWDDGTQHRGSGKVLLQSTYGSCQLVMRKDGSG
ncbi:hypothetical protein BKA62DRAFT_698344 [Auriculariales sp. MPI-PUGE-AT-0066]|nr:hypothetical protein BKA62DRAFT_698344 [Auriculariales sp. MPI-PUGE-AT-0066]